MNSLITFVIFIFLISFLVFVHELGHFLAAKITKVGVKEFAIGFGKNIISKTYRGTRYSFKSIPFGGFVELEGENENEASSPNGFRNKPYFSKALILVSGVLMNILMAVVLLTLYLNANNFTFILPKITEYTFNNIEKVQALSPITIVTIDSEGRSKDTLSSGERIVKINDEIFTTFDEFSTKLKSLQNQKVKFEFLDLDKYTFYTKEINIGEAKENGAILDVTLNPGASLYFVKYNQNLTAGISNTWDLFAYQMKGLGSIIQRSISSGDYTELSQSVGGLPSVGNQISQAVEYNALGYLVPLTALVSLSLAFFNILPFPALDGGQLAVITIETIFKRKFSNDTLGKISYIGFGFLMLLGLLVTIKDIVQLGWLQSILDTLRNALGK